ncbi:MAG: recombinase family protein [Lachnospiraceae bacterium]|nr:recombinase family protein [Lachnospiraceae bacterium]
MEQLRAVIYNRCSTEEESQRDALIKQVQESEACVRQQGWILVDSYVEARSGTTARGRKEYNRLYQDLQGEKFDIIVIKSLDRLMRNTKEWYLFLDCMQKNGKRLYMYLERKFYTPDDSLIIGIKAILAEEYSRELSKKINNAHQNRQKEGRSFVITNSAYGFRKLPDKSIVLDEREADMIRLLFQLSSEGVGTYVSSQILYERGYRNRKGERISASVIRKIIRNPLYKGDVVQNREHYDFESKRQIKNPKSTWVIHKGVLPAIVDAELYETANRCMDMRKREGRRGDAHKNAGSWRKYGLSGKLVCGLCGQPFYRTVRSGKREGAITWKCRSYLEGGRRQQNGCRNIHLSEQRFLSFVNCMGREDDIALQGEQLIKETLSMLQKALQEDSAEKKRIDLQEREKRIWEKKDRLLQKLLDGILSDEDFMRKNRVFEEQLENIQSQLRVIPLQKERLEWRMAELRKRLEEEIVEKARIAERIDHIQRIEVFPECLYLFLDAPDSLAWNRVQGARPLSVSVEGSPLAGLRLPQKCESSPQIAIEEEKRKILQYMREEPPITARKIAESMEAPLSRIHRRINSLKQEGRIQYSSPNGRGYWIIL